MATQYLHRITVAVSLSFPIDMLRYDGCYPRTEQDAGKIERINHRHLDTTADDRLVEVEKRGDKNAFFTDARWASFGCKIVDRSERWLEV